MRKVFIGGEDPTAGRATPDAAMRNPIALAARPAACRLQRRHGLGDDAVDSGGAGPCTIFTWRRVAISGLSGLDDVIIA